MTPADPNADSKDARETFEYFSNEYAEALQAFQAIEKQASTLMVMGYTGDLKQFIEQFLEMATRARDKAREKNEANFAEWFEELVQKANALRTALTR
jgi:hypothetical protein